MKKNMLYYIILASVFAFASCEQPYVLRERPRETINTPPPSPGSDYIWTGGEWVYAIKSPNHHQWQEGHWEKARPANIGYRVIGNL